MNVPVIQRWGYMCLRFNIEDNVEHLEIVFYLIIKHNLTELQWPLDDS